MLNVFKHRGGLNRTINCINRGELTIGFIGGSITDARPGHNWPEAVTSWLVEQFPHVRIYVENAAIGATASDLAVFRAERDLIQRGCDLVFVEFAVNDFVEQPEKRMKIREGLLRKLLAGSGRDLVLVYTFRQEMYDDMMNNRIPASIEEYEQLAEYYGIGSIWMGLYALEEVKKGRMTWDEWLPDGLHPTSRGSLSYAASVICFLNKELVLRPSEGEILKGDQRPSPLNQDNWEFTANIPLSEIKLEGPWTTRRWAKLEWIDQVLNTHAVGAKMSFTFEGRCLLLGFDFGKYSAEFRYRLDGQDWADVTLDRPWWCPDEGWFRLVHIADDVQEGTHEFELEVIHGNREDCKGTNFKLGLVGVVK